MIREKQHRERVIDLTGPQGNAFFLLGQARSFAKQLRFEQSEIDAMLEKMKSGDYEHLVQTFDEYFGTFVILER